MIRTVRIAFLEFLDGHQRAVDLVPGFEDDAIGAFADHPYHLVVVHGVGAFDAHRCQLRTVVLLSLSGMVHTLLGFHFTTH